MKGRNFRRLVSAILLAALLLTLTGCGAKSETAADSASSDKRLALETKQEDASAQEQTVPTEKPGKKQPLRGEQAHKPVETSAQESADLQTDASLLDLRAQMDAMDGAYVHFAAAYLGYVGGLFDEGFEKGFPKWLEETNPRQLEQNPFLRKIDENHIIGRAGHLYCIVPHDENASVAVNRIHWDPDAMDYVQDEVVYRMESGEPILLFANLDGNEYGADTEVTIVSENGLVCSWYPTWDIEDKISLPLDDSGSPCALDFTAYADIGVGEFGEWMANGWLGPTALGIAGEPDMGGQMWTAGAMTQDGRAAYFTLTFYPGDETGGQADLNWYYDGQSEYEELWSGFWTIQTELDQPSSVTLDLTRVGGANYDTVDGPYYFSETYPVMIAPSGESLMIAAGEHGIALPGMAESMLYLEFLLAMG